MTRFVSRSSPPLALALIFAAIVAAGPSSAKEKTQAGENAAADFQNAFNKIMRDQDDALSEYGKMRALYGRMRDMEKRQAAQLLSMADAMYGRYQDAEDHYHDAFPEGREPVGCPATGVSSRSALDAVGALPEDARVVLVNESHSMVATRAFIYRLLPVMRARGFKYLALEALAPSSAKPAKNAADSTASTDDAGIAARGYPLDKSVFGFYLREPIYAEIVRRAVSLGFTLVAYESEQVLSRDAREQAQADTLARLLDADPEAKLAVIAGYSHIWKADGWMADRLQKMTTGRIVSIDQVSGLWGCANNAFSARQNGLVPYVLVKQDGVMWAAMPEKTDITVMHPPRKDGRSASSGWLTLAGQRLGVVPETSACSDRWPCLVSAYYAGESRQAVPADRVLLNGENDRELLFLRPGQYRYTVKSGAGEHEESLIVP